MAKIRHKYSEELDSLWIDVDESEKELNMIAAVEGFVDLDLNPKTGAIYAIEIRNVLKIINGDLDSEYMEYDEETDSLNISFLEDGYEQLGCDCVFADMSQNAMITLDRNEVGNLQGIEVVSLSYFLE